MRQWNWRQNGQDWSRVVENTELRPLPPCMGSILGVWKCSPCRVGSIADPFFQHLSNNIAILQYDTKINFKPTPTAHTRGGRHATKINAICNDEYWDSWFEFGRRIANTYTCVLLLNVSWFHTLDYDKCRFCIPKCIIIDSVFLPARLFWTARLFGR